MTIQHNQSGRSMVEMLGVLAIIGVLSVGAITGYREAMAQKEANDFINALMIDFTHIKGILSQNPSIGYSFRYESSFNGRSIPYYYSGRLDSNSGAVCTDASFVVSKSVCQKLKDFDWDSFNTFGRMDIYNTFYCNGYMDLGGSPEVYLDMCLFQEETVIDF